MTIIDRASRRTLITGAFVAMLTTVASLLLVEFLVRIILPDNSFPAGTASAAIAPNAAVYGWGYAPGSEIKQTDPDTKETFSSRANSSGWKDVEHQLEKRKGSVRILILGDSNTFGHVPLNGVFPRVLEQLLSNAGFDAEVISIGYGGWSTDQELLALKRSGLAYEPDIVISQFDTNDLLENLALSGIETQKPFRFQVVNGDLNMRAVQPTPPSRLKTTLLKSHIVFHMNNVRWKLIERFNQFRESQNQRNRAKGNVSGPGHNPLGPYFAFHLSERGDPGIEQAWMLYEKLIEEMKRASTEKGAIFLIFNAVEKGSLAWAKRAGRVVEDEAGRDGVLSGGTFHAINYYRHVERLKDIAHRVGLPLIPNNRFYTRFDNDGHANVEGNRRMAEDILDFLVSNEATSRVLRQAHRRSH